MIQSHIQLAKQTRHNDGMKKAVVIDVTIPADSNIRENEHQKIKNYQGPLDRESGFSRFQVQYLIPVQKSAVLGDS